MTLRLAHEPLPRQAISVARASEIMGDDPSTVRRLLEDGELEGYRGGQGKVRPRWRVYVDSIEAYRQRRAAGAFQARSAQPPPPRAVAGHSPRLRASLAALKAAGWL